jgi:hypothetical protein
MYGYELVKEIDKRSDHHLRERFIHVIGKVIKGNEA